MDGSLFTLENPPTDIISCARFSPSSSSLLVGSWDCCIYFYDRTASNEAPFAYSGRVNTQAPVLDVCWGADEFTFFSVGLCQTTTKWQRGSEDGVVLSTHEKGSNNVAYSREHDTVLSTSWDGKLHVHDLGSSQAVRVRLQAKPFALSVNPSRAVVAMADRKVAVYDLASLRSLIARHGESTETLEAKPWQERESSLKFMTRAVACMPDGTGFATSSIEGRVSVEWFDEDMQGKTYAFKCHRQSVKTGVVAPDADGQEMADEEMVDYVYPVNALAFNPVYGTFATGGGDGIVVLWDAQTRRRVRQYKDLGDSVMGLDFSPDGKYLAVAVSPGFEDGIEDRQMDPSKVKLVVRELADGEAKGKAVRA